MRAVREERGGDGGGREAVRAVPCGVLLLRRVPEGALERAQEGLQGPEGGRFYCWHLPSLR